MSNEITITLLREEVMVLAEQYVDLQAFRDDWLAVERSAQAKLLAALGEEPINLDVVGGAVTAWLPDEPSPGSTTKEETGTEPYEWEGALVTALRTICKDAGNNGDTESYWAYKVARRALNAYRGEPEDVGGRVADGRARPAAALSQGLKPLTIRVPASEEETEAERCACGEPGHLRTGDGWLCAACADTADWEGGRHGD